MKQIEHYIGIDGCKAGWIAIHFINGVFSYQLIASLQELAFSQEKNTRLLIDMPLGLSSENKLRIVDKQLRSKLVKKGSSVFNAPSRPALYAASYQEANALNKSIEGKGLSKQSYHLFPKIRELETFYLETKSECFQIIESHPELCFQQLSDENFQVVNKKKDKAGQHERLELLASRHPVLVDLVDLIKDKTLRKHLALDDILDAMVLCQTNVLAASKNLLFVKDDNCVDALGIPMQIGYFKFH